MATTIFFWKFFWLSSIMYTDFVCGILMPNTARIFVTESWITVMTVWNMSIITKIKKFERISKFQQHSKAINTIDCFKLNFETFWNNDHALIWPYKSYPRTPVITLQYAQGRLQHTSLLALSVLLMWMNFTFVTIKTHFEPTHHHILWLFNAKSQNIELEKLVIIKMSFESCKISSSL